jgi:hypothetical protein
MRKLPIVTVVASVLWALPASVGYGASSIPSSAAVTVAQLDVCVGPDCRRERERRYFGRSDEDRRYRHDDDWRYRRGERCRDVTIRERRGDDVVVKRERRCD